MSGAQLDAAVLIEADLRKANLRGTGFRHAKAARRAQERLVRPDGLS
jgi:uncharacterized protein YjbI with pentapeptide repeats